MFMFFIEYLYIISALYKWTKHIVIVFVNNNNTDVKFRFSTKKIKTCIIWTADLCKNSNIYIHSKGFLKFVKLHKTLKGQQFLTLKSC